MSASDPKRTVAWGQVEETEGPEAGGMKLPARPNETATTAASGICYTNMTKIYFDAYILGN